MDQEKFRRLEINGGAVRLEPTIYLHLPPVAEGYADAQIDDYGRRSGQRHGRRAFRWRPGTALHLRARFSHPIEELRGTAGFGFWNAPIGDPTVPWPALPQATWFFCASAPTDLPLAPAGPGRGWFAATVDATKPSALLLAPLAPLVLLLNQVAAVRRRLWPALRPHLGISFSQLDVALTDWHTYDLLWLPQGCAFSVDGVPALQTPASPRGPLGFVCWLDNQYMVATARGRFAWGVLPTPAAQWLEVADLRIVDRT